MTQEQIIQGLKDVLMPIVKNKDQVINLTLESNVKTDLGLDSIGLIYTMTQFGKKFNIKLKDSKPSQFKTVNDFVNFVLNSETK